MVLSIQDCGLCQNPLTLVRGVGSREEQRRIVELAPLTTRKLSNAKRKGLIVDFRELREGVHQVKRNGCLFWEIVYEYKVEEFLARL